MSIPANRFRPRPTYTRIEGLSSTLRLPRLGKIRLGVKVKKAKKDGRCKHSENETCFYCTYPKDVDYFVVPPEVAEKYGEKPKELDVLIPCEDQAMFFPQSLKCYQGSRLWCKGDGRTATRINMDTGEMTERECPCEHYGKDCGERANLMVLLPKISMGGCWQVDTGSTRNIVELNSTVEWLRGMIGRIAFIPLKLKRVPTPMQITEEGGKVRTVTKALLKLEFEGNIMEVAALRQADIISIEGGHQPKALLPPTPLEDGDDRSPGAVIIEEEPFEAEEEATNGQKPPEDAQQEAISPPPDTPIPDEPDPEALGGEGPEIPDTAVIKAYILDASNAQEAMARFKGSVASNKELTNDQKLDLQDVLNRRLKELKSKR